MNREDTRTCCAFSVQGMGHKGAAAAGLEKAEKPLKVAWQLREKNRSCFCSVRLVPWGMAGPACHQGSGTTATTTVLHRQGKESHCPLISICLLFIDPDAASHGSITKSLVQRETKPESKPRLEAALYWHWFVCISTEWICQETAPWFKSSLI